MTIEMKLAGILIQKFNYVVKHTKNIYEGKKNTSKIFALTT